MRRPYEKPTLRRITDMDGDIAREMQRYAEIEAYQIAHAEAQAEEIMAMESRICSALQISTEHRIHLDRTGKAMLQRLAIGELERERRERMEMDRDAPF